MVRCCSAEFRAAHGCLRFGDGGEITPTASECSDGPVALEVDRRRGPRALRSPTYPPSGLRRRRLDPTRVPQRRQAARFHA